ncbi:FERM domain-containing protein 5-like [Pollicipes pollicipes]|uniref:FERM domain-containing protein 5-like n=1 Tax=Pollicipes pollicipes TaxID=41117 RepID=UPI001884C293|nr:FERM domain-containing protein 5-like [Pollicipes pollicipes]
MVFSFRVKFYPGWPERLQEELTRYQVYLQLKRDLLETGDYDPEEHRGRYASDYCLVSRASSRLEERAMELHCCQMRGLLPAPDQCGRPVSLGLNYRGISVIQDGRRSHLFRWQDVQKLNFENKMFIVHLVFVEDSRTKSKRTVGYKSDSVQKCRHFWRDATEHRLFFTAPRMVLGGSLFSRHSRVRFSGRTEREVCRQPVRRDPPQFNRYGLRPSVRRKAQSVPATPCDSQESSLADDEAMMVSPTDEAGRLLQPLSEIADYTPPSSPDLSPIRAFEDGGLLDTATTRELRAYPELQLLRHRLYEPAKQFVARGSGV